eukprot:TRINITY_DN64499_c0_g1_i1.p2 TRINITY_DN64499_c0_g1~~TRINITY_DN64499_c0_g1_i1.p2  ORF type:complete len:182 (+),score=0.04 TRINITY_DN64499_c0_g1_i1:374-919(+)
MRRHHAQLDRTNIGGPKQRFQLRYAQPYALLFHLFGRRSLQHRELEPPDIAVKPSPLIAFLALLDCFELRLTEPFRHVGHRSRIARIAGAETSELAETSLSCESCENFQAFRAMTAGQYCGPLALRRDQRLAPLPHLSFCDAGLIRSHRGALARSRLIDPVRFGRPPLKVMKTNILNGSDI